MTVKNDADKKRLTPLEIEQKEFKKIGYDLVDKISELLATMNEHKVVKYADSNSIRKIINSTETLPQQGSDSSKLMQETSDLLIEHSLYNGHPNFYGYITSSPTPIGILGDLLASAINQNVGAFQLSPVATEIEAQTIRWIAEFIKYPVNCGGILVSGGNMANFICFLAARVAKAKHNIREAGAIHPEGKKLFVYASKETHTWVQKAADLFGLGTDAIRWIDTDTNFHIDLTKLKKAVEDDIANGDLPMLIVGTAGTVSTGAVDPLTELAHFCKEKDIWFHVDGAYGAFASIAENTDPNIHGLSLADSVAVDPHKWLYAPLEAGCALVRNIEHLRNAFSYHPPYYRFDEETTNYFDLGMQNSRGFRALKIWLAFKQVGSFGYKNMIETDIDLTKLLYQSVVETNELQAYSCNLSIATFRFVPQDLESKIGSPDVEEYLNMLNEKLLTRLKESGEIFLSNAVIGGVFTLRTCIVNFRTSAEHVRALPEVVVRHGKALDKQLRVEHKLS